MFGAIAGGIASALAGGAMSKLFGGGQKAASGGIQGDVLATDNNTVGMGDAGIKSAIQGSNVPNPDEAVPSFVSGAMAKAGKGLLEGTLQAGTSAVSDKLLDLVGLGGKSAADKGKDTRDYLAARSEERRVGKECRSRWWAEHRKKSSIQRAPSARETCPCPNISTSPWTARSCAITRSVFFFKQKTAYEVGLGIPAEPLFRS